jgi:hypothetical protein
MSGQGALRFRNDRALPLGRRNQSESNPVRGRGGYWTRAPSTPIPGTCPCPILAAHVKQQRNRGRRCACRNCHSRGRPRPFGESRADHLSASWSEAFRLLKASNPARPVQMLQCFNRQVQADRQFLANSRSGLKLLFRFERPTNSLQLRLMSRVCHLRQSGRRQVSRGLPRTSCSASPSA